MMLLFLVMMVSTMSNDGNHEDCAADLCGSCYVVDLYICGKGMLTAMLLILLFQMIKIFFPMMSFIVATVFLVIMQMADHNDDFHDAAADPSLRIRLCGGGE